MLKAPLLVGVLCLGGQPPSGDGIRHEVGDIGGPRLAPASLEPIQSQLDAADRRLGEREGERLAVWDVAAAGSQAEHENVGQGVFVLVVAVAQSETDLPLRRVYVSGPNGKPVALVRLGIVPRERLGSLRISGKAGKNVWAGLYLLPAARRIAGAGSLFADFVTREDFRLGVLPKDLFGTLEDRPGKVQIYLGNVALMARREFPVVELNPDLVKALEQLEKAKEEQATSP